jgi:hypothetical protein
MTDDISPSRSRSKKVDHTKVIKGVLPGLNTLIIDVPPNYDTYHGNRVYWNPGAGWGPPPFDNMGTNQYVFNWPKTDQAFIADSFDTFFNRNQVDNLLNIIESKDIVPRLQSINTTLSERAIVTPTMNLLKVIDTIVRSKTGRQLPLAALCGRGILPS